MQCKVGTMYTLGRIKIHKKLSRLSDGWNFESGLTAWICGLQADLATDGNMVWSNRPSQDVHNLEIEHRLGCNSQQCLHFLRVEEPAGISTSVKILLDPSWGKLACLRGMLWNSQVEWMNSGEKILQTLGISEWKKSVNYQPKRIFKEILAIIKHKKVR